MSFWNDVRYPVIGGALGGVNGATIGLGANIVNGNNQNNQSLQNQANAYQNSVPLPGDVQYQQGYNPSQALAPQLDKSGLNKFRSEALRGGPSAWAGLADQQQNLEQQNQTEQGARGIAGQTATARADLASKGGLSSGASERLARGGAQDFLNLSQNAARSGAQNRLQIGANDEQNRINQLQALPGMELQSLQPAQFDVQQKAQEAQNVNQFNLGQYQSKMQNYGAAQTAGAIAASGQKGPLGSWLCTEALKNEGESPDWKYLSELKKFALKKNPKLTKFYLRECHALVNQMNIKHADWEKNKKFVGKVVRLVKDGNIEKAYDVYLRVFRGLVIVYWPEAKGVF